MPLAVETVNKRHKKKKVVDQWMSLQPQTSLFPLNHTHTFLTSFPCCQECRQSQEFCTTFTYGIASP